MNLRTQMLLAGALTFAVPIVGWQSVKQLNESLRQTRVDEQSLKVANARLALAESDSLRPILQASRATARSADVYAEKANFPVFIDGYIDEWHPVYAPTLRFNNDNDQVRIRTATGENRLFMFIEVRDELVVYHRPQRLSVDRPEVEYIDEQARLSNGDAVEILVGSQDEQVKHVLFRTIAPGPVSGLTASINASNQPAGRKMSAYNGFWVATATGFQLEISIPLPPPSTPVGIAFVDIDQSGAARTSWLGTMSPESMAGLHAGEAINDIGNLYYSSDAADERLIPWVTRGTRARLFDRQGRLLSDINSLYEKTDTEYQYSPADGGFLNAVLFRIFAYFVSDAEITGQPFTIKDGLHLPPEDVETLANSASETKHYITNERDEVLGTLVAIGGDAPNGFLLFESNEDLASAYSASRVARLFSLLTLVSLLAGLVLLGYASTLSMRIRSLSKLATKAVTDDGRVRGLPHSDAKDEIGDLSRHLSALLDRSANYTKYLEALSSRLSHELRTPLSVVKTSIENMDRDKLDAESTVLIDRASGGADQLGAIIRALVESTRLEQTVQRAQMQNVDLTSWFNGSIARYKQIYPETHIQSRINVTNQKSESMLNAHASDELLQQALDKLVDNAIAFSTDNAITLLLDAYDVENQRMVAIGVSNKGVHIPQDRQAHLFDPMFSDRQTDDGELHLGLGLYIVRMISEAHQGFAWIRNMDKGVMVGLSIPLRDRM